MTSLAMATTFPSIPSLSAPPPTNVSSLQQMPNVFVIPPEEEQEDTPPWCYFNAAIESKSPLCTSPDMDAVDVALGFYQQTDNRAPLFQRASGNESQETVVMPKRSLSRGELVSDEVGSRPSIRGRVMDEEIVEVFKVRRNEGMSDVADVRGNHTTLKKSKTFRARASQAFRTIRNVGKVTRKPHSTDLPSLQYSGSVDSDNANTTHGIAEDGTLPRPSTPGLSHRKSIVLPRIFTSVRNNRSATAAQDIPMSPTSPITASSTDSAISYSRPSSSLGDRTNAPLTAPRSEQEQPPLNSKKSFRKRISVLDLQRLFTPSTASAPTQSAQNENTPRPPRRDSLPLPGRVSAMSSRIPTASEGMDNDAGDDVFSSRQPRPHSYHALGSDSPLALPPLTLTARKGARAEQAEADALMGDAFFEMQLDSLHFDSLHFDPDEF